MSVHKQSRVAPTAAVAPEGRAPRRTRDKGRRDGGRTAGRGRGEDAGRAAVPQSRRSVQNVASFSGEPLSAFSLRSYYAFLNRLEGTTQTNRLGALGTRGQGGAAGHHVDSWPPLLQRNGRRFKAAEQGAPTLPVLPANPETRPWVRRSDVHFGKPAATRPDARLVPPPRWPVRPRGPSRLGVGATRT